MEKKIDRSNIVLKIWVLIIWLGIQIICLINMSPDDSVNKILFFGIILIFATINLNNIK